MSRQRTRPPAWLPLALALLLSGCQDGVDTTYGQARGTSVNGTGVFAEMLRQAGHTVRASVRLGEARRFNADVLVRFAPIPGPPAVAEAKWYQKWLEEDPRRRLLYVPEDFDAEAEYWAAALAALPANADPAERKAVEKRRTRVLGHKSMFALPTQDKDHADPIDWFEIQESKAAEITPKTLEGPWSEGVDAKDAALTLHHKLVEDGQTVLLRGEGSPLAYQWHWPGPPPDGLGATTLVVANGSFLLNEPLAHRARRPLARKVVEWVGPEPRRVLFLEGWRLSEQEGAEGSPFALLKVPPMGLIFGHWAAVLLLLALSKAVILGRPRSAPPAGADRPAAHAEALGHLLMKTRDIHAARALLDVYRRWRYPGGPPTPPRDPRP